LCLFRINFARAIGTVRREFGPAHFVMVVGSNERARHLGAALERSVDCGIRLMGFLDDEPGEDHLRVDSGKLAGMEEVFPLCDEEGVRTRVVVDFFQHVNSDVYLDRLGNTPLLTFPQRLTTKSGCC
jgi:hypothetical protein